MREPPGTASSPATIYLCGCFLSIFKDLSLSLISIFSLYKGYAIEFLLSPNPGAASQSLTDEQLQTAVDFLSNLEFIPANGAENAQNS